jgi:hypothetical protein
MNRCYRLLIYIALTFSCGSNFAQQYDPGVRDTVRVEDARLLVGQSRPVTLSLFNDSTVHDWTTVLLTAPFDSGFARFDSARFVGRLADPAVLGLRFVNVKWVDGVSPDSLLLAALTDIFAPLPPGDGPIVDLYFTGLHPGIFSIDTSRAGHGVGLGLSTLDIREYIPEFTTVGISIDEAPPPPEVRIVESLPVYATASRGIELNLEVTSPYGSPVAVALTSFTDFDTGTRQPWSEPSLSVVGPPRFHWTPDLNDVGIWDAVFTATDTAGSRTVIMIVESEDHLLRMFPLATTDAPYVTSLAFGNLDNDRRFEVLMSGYALPPKPSLAIYDYFPGGSLQKVYEETIDQYSTSLVPGFIDRDHKLDAVFSLANVVTVAKGTGSNSFDLVSTGEEAIRGGKGATLLDFDRDRYLDYVQIGPDLITVYRGEADFGFAPVLSFAPSVVGLSIQSGDFDGDGFDDLAVGTVAGLEIYSNDGEGDYEFVDYHEQQFGTSDIDVTGAGSDFDGDGIYDLCLASPSVGGTHSELVVYRGNGDATFEPILNRTLRGQVCAARAGDFNGDTFLDVAFLNSSLKYLGLLFGDGQAGFASELRFPVPLYSPRHLVCFDVDLDGDLDAVVSSYEPGQSDQALLYLFENHLDPNSVVGTGISLRASDNVDLELRAPSGAIVNRRVNSIASAAMYRRDLNDNELLDMEVVSGAVEIGRYEIAVAPCPGLNVGELFSLSYLVSEDTFRVVDGLPMDEQGYVFPFYPVGQSLLSPKQGEFIQTSLPTFVWASAGVERFEIATDIKFTDILESAVVSQGVYTPQIVLPNTDSSAYYWRVHPEGQKASNEIYVFHVMRSPTDVETPEGTEILPDSCWLSQNYPNPFNPHTSIVYHVAQSGQVRISIHNVLGQLINTLIDGPMPAGTFTVDWDAGDLTGRQVASGIYFYRMEIGEFSSTRKMVLVR